MPPHNEQLGFTERPKESHMPKPTAPIARSHMLIRRPASLVFGKAWLEHAIQLNLVGDHNPDHHVKKDA